MDTRCTNLNRQQREARRRRAGRLFAKGLSQAEVARRLHVTPMSVSRWHAAWEAQGEEGLRSKGAPGPPPRLSEVQRQELVAALLAGPLAAGYTTDVWSAPRVRRLLLERFGIRYHVSHVWLLLRQLGFSWQKPATRAKERNEAAIARWRTVTWPREKRGRAAGAPRCSSGTKRASPSVPR